MLMAAGAGEGEVEGLGAGAPVGAGHEDAHVALGEGVELAERAIGRAGVNDDELEVGEGLPLEALHAATHGLLGVEGRHENGDRWCCWGVVRH